MKLSAASYTVFDVETTGLYPYSGDRICEIAAIRIEPKKKAKKFHSLINPKRPISYGAFSVNGITEDMVKDAPTIEEILPSFMDFIKNTTLVAYNAGFDLGFLECALGKKRDVLNDYYIIDALKLARRLFPECERYNLATVASSLGIKIEGEHRALADTHMAWKVFEKELEVLAAEGIDAIEKIAYARTARKEPVKKIKDYKVKLIKAAIKDEKELNIVYRSVWNNKVSTRKITPKELREGYDKSYLIAHCHLTNEERNFRLDGIILANPAE